MKIESVKAFKNFLHAENYIEETLSLEKNFETSDHIDVLRRYEALPDHPDMLYVSLDTEYAGVANVEMLFTKHFGLTNYKPFAVKFEGEGVQVCINDLLTWFSIKTGQRFTNKRNGSLNKNGKRFVVDLQSAVMSKLGTKLWMRTDGIAEPDDEDDGYVCTSLSTMNTIVSQTGWGFNPNYKG